MMEFPFETTVQGQNTLDHYAERLHTKTTSLERIDVPVAAVSPPYVESPGASVLEQAVHVVSNNLVNLDVTSATEKSVKILSMRSSVGDAYQLAVPEIMDCYEAISLDSPRIFVHVTHVVPPHKSIIPPNQQQHQSTPEAVCQPRFAGDILDANKIASPSLTPRQMQSYFSQYGGGDTPMSPELDEDDYGHRKIRASLNYMHSSSPGDFGASSLSRSGSCSSRQSERSRQSGDFVSAATCTLLPGGSVPRPLQDVFESYSFMTTNDAIVAPPSSIHYTFAVLPLPTHVLPPFKDFVKARLRELVPGGCMILLYPSNLAFFNKTISPCLDRALRQMLALSIINTNTCELISQPPPTPLDFDQQLGHLQSLDVEVLFSTARKNVEIDDWDKKWASEEYKWYANIMAKEGHRGHNTLMEMLQALEGQKRGQVGVSDVSVFVLRKI